MPTLEGSVQHIVDIDLDIAGLPPSPTNAQTVILAQDVIDGVPELTRTTPVALNPPHDHPHAHDGLYSPLDHQHIKVLAPTHFTIAAVNSLFAENAMLRCDGIHDEEQFNLAVQSLAPQGGEIELLDGGFVYGDVGRINRERVKVWGHGGATTISHAPDFPADQFIVDVYKDEMKPMPEVTLRDFTICGINVPQDVHGIRFVSHLGLIDHVNIKRLRGVGLRTRNTKKPNGSEWNAYEAMFDHMNIGGCRIGIDAVSTDQHFANMVVSDCVEANLKGSMTGCMVVNSHFYAGPDNYAATQTLDNLVLLGGYRTGWTRCKFEHGRQRVIYFDGRAKAGFMIFGDCGTRNGSGEGANLWPQWYIDGTGGNRWRLLVSNCPFDADNSQPSWNILIKPGFIANSRFGNNSFDNAVTGDVTPFGPNVGLRSTFNNVGFTSIDPNTVPVPAAPGVPAVVNDWYGYGEKGMELEGAGFLWRAKSETEWVKVCAI